MAWYPYRRNIASIGLWQEIYTIDMLRALKSSLEHSRKYVLRSLQLSGDQVLSTTKKNRLTSNRNY